MKLFDVGIDINMIVLTIMIMIFMSILVIIVSLFSVNMIDFIFMLTLSVLCRISCFRLIIYLNR